MIEGLPRKSSVCYALSNEEASLECNVEISLKDVIQWKHQTFSVSFCSAMSILIKCRRKLHLRQGRAFFASIPPQYEKRLFSSLLSTALQRARTQTEYQARLPHGGECHYTHWPPAWAPILVGFLLTYLPFEIGVLLVGFFNGAASLVVTGGLSGDCVVYTAPAHGCVGKCYKPQPLRGEKRLLPSVYLPS